jgi:hypothetical protein
MRLRRSLEDHTDHQHSSLVVPVHLPFDGEGVHCQSCCVDACGCVEILLPLLRPFPRLLLSHGKGQSPHDPPTWFVPLAFGRNLQCQPVRGVNTREECHWSHAWQRFKRSKGVKLNGIPECEFLPKTGTVLYSLLVPSHHPIPNSLLQLGSAPT